MKLTVPVEIEWLEEGGSIDGAVKEQLIEKVVGQIGERVIDDLAGAVHAQIEAKADELVNGLFEQLMKLPVPVTDQWGESKKASPTVKDLIKEKIDRYLTEKVDRYGERSYSGGQTRLEVMLGKRVQDGVDEAVKKIIAQIDAKIAATLSESIKTHLSQSLLAKLDVDGIIAKTVGMLSGK